VKESAYVFITGRRQKETRRGCSQPYPSRATGNVTGVQGDIAKLTDLDRLYKIVATKGRIDVVFANAGVAEFAPLGKLRRSISTNSSASTSRNSVHGAKSLPLRLSLILAAGASLCSWFRNTRLGLVARRVIALTPPLIRSMIDRLYNITTILQDRSPT